MYDRVYLTTITNLDDSYAKGQKPRLRVFVRDKNWQPNIYTVANAAVETTIEDAYYRIFRSIQSRDHPIWDWKLKQQLHSLIV